MVSQPLINLSQSYAAPDIALKQREGVDKQLLAMQNGTPAPHFAVVGEILTRLREQSGLQSVSLLDAGCSSAYYSEIIEYFVPNWARYIGVDYNTGMVKLAHRHYPNTPVFQADLQDLRQLFGDRFFDIVLTGATVGHIMDWKRVLEELTRVTKQWLILHRAWVYTDGRPTAKFIQDAYDHDVLYWYFNEAELICNIESHGLELISSCNSGEGPRDSYWEVRTYLFERERSGDFA